MTWSRNYWTTYHSYSDAQWYAHNSPVVIVHKIQHSSETALKKQSAHIMRNYSAVGLSVFAVQFPFDAQILMTSHSCWTETRLSRDLLVHARSHCRLCDLPRLRYNAARLWVWDLGGRLCPDRDPGWPPAHSRCRAHCLMLRLGHLSVIYNIRQHYGVYIISTNRAAS